MVSVKLSPFSGHGIGKNEATLLRKSHPSNYEPATATALNGLSSENSRKHLNAVENAATALS